MIDFDNIIKTVPRTEFFPEYDTSGSHNGTELGGIKALSFDGADYKGQKTKVFAHIGYPEKAEGKVPAVVLIHGGGGHPEDMWIKKWNDKGFAAIAMDTTGYFPTKKIPHLYEGFSEGLERRLTAPFYEEGYTVGPDNSCMTDMNEDTENQWMYHSVAAVILSHNILRSDIRIDADKIGICGISWGGVIASIAIGYDSRFSFAVPIYGSGFARKALTYSSSLFSSPEHEKWLAEKNFPKVKMPVMWLCWNDDCNFSINSNSLSFLATKDNNRNTCLSMLHNMRHSHLEGYSPEESYWFAKKIISGGRIPAVEADFRDGRVYYSCSEDVESVRLFYITEKMTYALRKKHRDKNCYMEQEWNILKLRKDASSYPLPENAVGKYVEFTLTDGIRLTSPYCE